MTFRSGKLVLSALLLMIGCASLIAVFHRHHPVILPSDAYIWQRQWTPGVLRSIDQSMETVRSWHVLAAERDQNGAWHQAHLDAARDALRGHDVVAVFRLSGRTSTLNASEVLNRIRETLSAWHEEGIEIREIEIDHDCPTSRLSAYAGFLDQIRHGLDPRYRLALTALPAWLGSPDLPRLLSMTDEAVLQLHAVLNPIAGLFDITQAFNAARRFGQIAPRPWRIALPSYGSRVVWAPDGRIAVVESEAPQGVADEAGQELVAEPVRVAAFMNRVEADPPQRLIGWIWFRLPVATDRRAWSLSSWLAVMRHDALKESVTPMTRPVSQGLVHIVARNTGTIDAMMPLVIHVESTCRGIGAQMPYRLEYDTQGAAVLVRARKALLPVGQEIVAGWLSCQQEKEPVHVR
ncbi:DUF3142 domain-containing protein [Asaia astilbis]